MYIRGTAIFPPVGDFAPSFFTPLAVPLSLYGEQPAIVAFLTSNPNEPHDNILRSHSSEFRFTAFSPVNS